MRMADEYIFESLLMFSILTHCSCHSCCLLVNTSSIMAFGDIEETRLGATPLKNIDLLFDVTATSFYLLRRYYELE
ncbi:hypothetical protein V1477_005518 [Vespula maculifrons]|uniref:Uncharacterized protein n=2 Tax=Vespula TaxID=7451 RepID=A0A834KIH9_VESVU|nr:hypothetical protein HZH66_001812 [Vespula vulgaris]